ncbi:MAG: hypothetical protein RQ758_06725 [Methanomicrobiaceae archaeon]|nr:hypothetical protein [Methanomicrobiaceae archaeon]
MVLASFREAAGLLLRLPVLWVNGLAWGAITGALIILSFSPETFLLERVGILVIIVLPFFVGGALGLAGTREGGAARFFREGLRHYFPLLLPTVIIFLAWVLTLFLLSVTLLMIGVALDPTVLTMLLSGTLVPILFFTFFYDCAAVQERRKVFDSIRRSIEFVILRPWKVVAFHAVSAAFLLAIYIVLNLLWVVLLPDAMGGLTQMNQTAIMELSREEWMALLGERGILITGGVISLAIAVAVTVLYAFKSTFFAKYARELQAPAPEGEYDQKGRWYRY